MADPISALIALATLGEGISAKKAADEEAGNIEKQAAIGLAESRDAASITGEQFERFQTKQKLSFLKSGVSLEGSPLLVLAETAKESKRQTDAILNRGLAVAGLRRDRARSLKRAGRARLLSSLFTAGGQAGTPTPAKATTGSGAGSGASSLTSVNNPFGARLGPLAP